jgi:fucose 4-O-acetylase-like acetyltransferase
VAFGLAMQQSISVMATATLAPQSVIVPTSRLNYFDNLRVFLTILVVIHHAGQPYGPTGGAWPFFHATKFALLGPFFHVNASFFMGLFFLLSGYFVPPAYDRKGAAHFLKDRFRRLGIPVLLWGFLVYPLATLAIGGKVDHFEWAHLWFLGHLMVYSLSYAAYRQVRASRPVRTTTRPFPGSLAITGYVAALAIVSTIVRIWFPMDKWITFPVRTELAHLPQYCSLFLFGVAAYRYRWLERIPARTGKLWLGIGLAAVAVRFSYQGWPLPALAWNLWEALLCAGLCVGLVYWFQQHVQGKSKLARNAYGVYLVHIPILVGVQLAFEHTRLGPLALTIVTGAITLVLSYRCTSALRRIPGAESVL